MKKILVYEYLSGGGAPGAADIELRSAGLAMRNALVADLAAVPGWRVTCASGEGVSAPLHATAVTPLAGEAAADFVARNAGAHDHAWVIAPESGGLLARLRAAVGEARWIGCDAASIRLCASKQATINRLTDRGIPTPQRFMSDPRIDHWLVKPDDGAGAAGTRRHASREAAKADWTHRMREGEGATLEPWVDGETLSLSLLCTGGRGELLSVNRQSIEVDDQGRVAFEGVEIDVMRPDHPRMGALRETARQVVNAIPGLRGYVGVDLVWHAVHGPVIIEVNPRLTCAYVGLSAALKRNIAADVLALHAPREPAGALL